MTVTRLDDMNFDKEVKKSGLPVIIDFWAEWCGPCKMMGPVFEDVANDFYGKIKFAKLNVDDYGNIAQQYNIKGIPCLIVTQSGNEIGRIIGYMEKDDLKNEIDKIIGQ
ncbi:thioredoxin [Candidatus Woesearchaeota archaeon CG11_big_fil_rev_8_21_14_0_20_43_8]|nr:MAG: thioredoxin [Candidatus Woesearchaeota archaeon CG11_big_fil_rev_8_21_14_0_20_43_8]